MFHRHSGERAKAMNEPIPRGSLGQLDATAFGRRRIVQNWGAGWSAAGVRGDLTTTSRGMESEVERVGCGEAVRSSARRGVTE